MITKNTVRELGFITGDGGSAYQPTISTESMIKVLADRPWAEGWSG